MTDFMRAARTTLAAGLAALLGLAAAGCSPGGDSSSSVTDAGPYFGRNDPNVVVALGDSITFGRHDIGVEECTESERDLGGFCAVLRRLVSKVVINEGVCGDDSAGGVERVNDVLRYWRPAVLLIDYSPNDVDQGSGVLIANLRAIVAAARSNHTVPILGTLVPAVGDHEGWEPFIESANSRIRSLCSELGIECADHYQAFLNDPNYRISPYALLSPDGLHPNRAGYELMAKTWRWPLLRVY